ncbi:unnamed protein product, partial [Prorocentrum cordatum]
EVYADFEEGHLKFHEVELLPEGRRSLGCCVDGKLRATGPADESFAMVRKDFGRLLRRPEVAGWQLQTVLGHVTFMGLELACYLGIVVLLKSSWARPLAPVVYSSDASLFGYSVAEACFDPEAVAEVGRVSEPSRWRLGAGLARQRAFECAGFLLDVETGQVVRDAEGAPRQLGAELRRVLASERCEADPSFPEVPSLLLHDSHWTALMAD